jgi:hypothetical protein
MPLTTNPSFNVNNAALAKRPLYVVQIEGVLDILTSFRPEDMNVSHTGYGVNGYGTTGYGY